MLETIAIETTNSGSRSLLFNQSSAQHSISPLPKQKGNTETYLHGILPLREMHLPLLLLIAHNRRLMLRQPPSHRPRLLGAQVERQVLLVLVEEAELGPLGGVDDGEDAGDGFTEVVAI